MLHSPIYSSPICICVHICARASVHDICVYDIWGLSTEHFYPCSNSLQWPLLQAIPLIYQSLRMEAGVRAQSGLRSSLKFICRRFTVTLLSLIRPNHLNAVESAVLHVVAAAATTAAATPADEEEMPMIPVADCRSRSFKQRRSAHRIHNTGHRGWLMTRGQFGAALMKRWLGRLVNHR